MTTFSFRIGYGDWEKDIKEIAGFIDKDFFRNFTPVSLDEINNIEKSINRKFPEEFKLFYNKIGCGLFPTSFGGGIDSPEEIIENCYYAFLTKGSLTPGDKWASEAEQRKYYVTYGDYNPDPERFTENSLMIGDISLLDLVSIGADGCGYYYYLYTGKNANFEFYVLDGTGDSNCEYDTFSEGLISIFEEALIQLSLDNEIKITLREIGTYRNDAKNLEALCNALINAVSESNLEKVREALEAGADVNTREKGIKNTPLIIASKNGKLSIVKLLLQYNADVNIWNAGRYTPLMYNYGRTF